VAAPGASVAPGGRPLAVVHARTEDAADAAAAAVLTLITVGDTAPPATPVVTEVLR
jgi:thymidine phosphorylase